MSSKIAVVVLNYKGQKDTLACLASLEQQSYKNFHIVIIDNGSNDGSAEKLSTLESDNVTVICNERNLGFTGGVNTGILWANDHSYDFVALLNNDAVADNKWLESLLKAQRRHKSGITTALLLDSKGVFIDSTGEWYSSWGLPFPRNRGDDKSETPKEGLIFGATGGSSLYSLEMIQEIGMFDDVFFAYYEDIDLSFRAQLAGWKVVFTPHAIAYHEQGATSKKIPGLAVRNTFRNLPLLFKKNVPGRLFITIGVRFFVAYWLMLGKAIVRGDGKYALVGFVESIYYSPRAILQRINIQRKRRVSITYINRLIAHDLPPDQKGLRKLRDIFHR